MKTACKSEISSLIDKQTAAVKFIRKSNMANRCLRKFQVDMHKTVPNPFDQYHASLGWEPYPHAPLRLVIAGKTRWWSVKKQNKRFLRLRPSLVPTLAAQLERDDIAEDKRWCFDFNASDWKVMEQLDDILNPFKGAIKTLEGEKYPTLSMVTTYCFSLQAFVQNRLDALQGNSEWNSRVRSLLRSLKSGIDHVCEELPEEAFIASLLDPRYFDTFIPVAQRERWWARLQELIEEVPVHAAAEAEILPNIPLDPSVASNRVGTRSQPNPPIKKLSIDEIMTQRFVAKGAAEASKSPFRGQVPIRMVDPLQWWKVKESTYPSEAKLARRYLAIPASSAPCERLFSTGGRVLEKRRASLKPETTRCIVFLHDNLHLLDEIAEEDDMDFLDDE